jgi:NADP-dependent 3-hydroxy acid dehydrogenase YdfG
MPDDPVGDSGASIDDRHLLLVGAGPGLGLAIARRFGVGGYAVTLVARNAEGLDELAETWLTPAPKSTRSQRKPAIPKACVTV